MVTHGAFLHYLTEDWEDSHTYEGTCYIFNLNPNYNASSRSTGTGWSNTEYRTYEVMARDDNDDVIFLETVESRCRRAKLVPVPTREVQDALYDIAQQAWKRQGYLLRA